VPILETASSKRRSRAGDFLAVLLLLVIVAGVGWLWWHQKHPVKNSKTRPMPVVRTVKKPLPNPLVVPSLVLVEKKVEPPMKKPKLVPPALPPVISSNVPVPLPVVAAEFPRPVQNLLEAQVVLARRAISPGSIDGAIGSQTRAALAAFQRSQKLFESRALDTNTRVQLTLETPLLTDYVVTTNDLARLQPLGKTWLAKSQQSALEYETVLELVAEKAHAHPVLIQKLNPEVNWTDVTAGTVLKIPDVNYPEPGGKAARVMIHLSERFLEAFDAETNLLAHFPCSIGARFDKRPVGELKVKAIAPNPNYTFDPAVFAESAEAQAIGRKLVLPPGPNNPVGVAWIGLDKPGYGMHGTPGPEQVGRTESHGCFRLANWDAEYLVKLVWIGFPVEVMP
jgi:lipoprotein-anchoring transpeptidase ErfK/SrfK